MISFATSCTAFATGCTYSQFMLGATVFYIYFGVFLHFFLYIVFYCFVCWPSLWCQNLCNLWSPLLFQAVIFVFFVPLQASQEMAPRYLKWQTDSSSDPPTVSLFWKPFLLVVITFIFLAFISMPYFLELG